MSDPIIVLAMHGMPPKDFPSNEKTEMMKLKAKDTSTSAADEKNRFKRLEDKMRSWPRTVDNDPFATAAEEIAQSLEQKTGYSVVIGYNEFCAPNCQEALDIAASKNPSKVIVVTPMVTRGGNHSEEEIPEIIEEAQKRHPDVKFQYAWPFKTDHIADFLAQQIN